MAASIPLAYATAHRMMVTRANVTADDSVLVLGASGGVGTACVLLAKAAGATVIACASSRDKLERLRALGADHLVNYVEQNMREAVWEHRREAAHHRRRRRGPGRQLHRR